MSFEDDAKKSKSYFSGLFISLLLEPLIDMAVFILFIGGLRGICNYYFFIGWEAYKFGWFFY